jgi:putative aldouronate transport system substrate-binding protein
LAANLLAAMLTAMLALPGCAGAARQAPVPALAEGAALPTITMLASKVDTGHFDGGPVAEALDAYVSPRIGAHVALEFVEMDQYDQAVAQSAVSGTLPDVFLIWDPDIEQSLFRNGQILALDGLLSQYGEGTRQWVGGDLLGAHTFDGHVYGIPNLFDRAVCICFEYRAGIADAYGLDMGSVRSFESLTGVLRELHRKAPGLTPISEWNFTTWDTLGDSLGVLMDGGRGAEVANLYETEEYEAICRLVRQWRDDGLIEDQDSDLASINRFERSPEYFGRLSGYNPGLPYLDAASAGEPIECVLLTEPFTCTDKTKYGAWAVSSATASPEASMRFIELMYTDPAVANLLSYGVEGAHYVVVDREGGVIGFPEGVDAATSEYAQFRNYHYGNEFITYVWEGFPADLWEQVRRFNDSAARSRAYGFSYDRGPVEEQAYACQKAVQEYGPLLRAGIGDTDRLLGEFQDALRRAGIDAVVAEKQRQLDAWLAAG